MIVETLTTSSESMEDFGGYTGSEIISCGDPTTRTLSN